MSTPQWMQDIDEHRRLVKYYLHDFVEMTKAEAAKGWFDLKPIDYNLFRLAQCCVAMSGTPHRAWISNKLGADVLDIIVNTDASDLNNISKLLELRAEMHDLSKLAPPEREVFEVFTPKLKTLVYDSPEYKHALIDMGEGLQHHYQFNSHHPEHYFNGVAGMTLLDLIEMFCDWVAACDQKQVQLDIDRNVARFKITPGIAALLTNTRDMLRQWHAEHNCPSYF